VEWSIYRFDNHICKQFKHVRNVECLDNFFLYTLGNFHSSNTDITDIFHIGAEKGMQDAEGTPKIYFIFALILCIFDALVLGSSDINIS